MRCHYSDVKVHVRVVIHLVELRQAAASHISARTGNNPHANNSVDAKSSTYGNDSTFAQVQELPVF